MAIIPIDVESSPDYACSGSMATMDNRQPKVYEGGCQNLEFLVSDKRPNPAIYYHMGPADHMTSKSIVSKFWIMLISASSLRRQRLSRE